MSTILVVATEASIRDRVGAAIEAAGWSVLNCPGPAGPDYVCLGVRGSGCPLADEADGVVLDLDLDSDLVMEGTTAIELVAFYLAAGRPVVALAHEGVAFTHPFAEDRLRVLRWPVEDPTLVDVVYGLVPTGWKNLGPSARRLASG